MAGHACCERPPPTKIEPAWHGTGCVSGQPAKNPEFLGMYVPAAARFHRYEPACNSAQGGCMNTGTHSLWRRLVSLFARHWKRMSIPVRISGGSNHSTIMERSKRFVQFQRQWAAAGAAGGIAATAIVPSSAPRLICSIWIVSRVLTTSFVWQRSAKIRSSRDCRAASSLPAAL